MKTDFLLIVFFNLELMQIREYHRRHPNAKMIDAGDDPEELLKEEPWVDFSGEVSSLFLIIK